MKRLRTVTVNDRGQIVIPEEVRKDFGIKKDSTLVLIEKNREILLRKESDVMDRINDDKFWKAAGKKSMKRAWHKEDEVWDRLHKKKS